MQYFPRINKTRTPFAMFFAHKNKKTNAAKNWPELECSRLAKPRSCV